MANHLIVGQRVQTPLGLATILGFEEFDSKGSSKPLRVEYDSGGRVCCKLDEPDNWFGSKQGMDPYIFRSQLAECNEINP